MSNARTYYISGDKTDHAFWVDSTAITEKDDQVFYEVDFGDDTRLQYSGPPDAHKEVLADAVLRLVRQNRLPEYVLERPLRIL